MISPQIAIDKIRQMVLNMLVINGNDVLRSSVKQTSPVQIAPLHRNCDVATSS